MVAKVEALANLPDWPEALSREQAAIYCGVSPGLFDRHIADTGKPGRTGGNRVKPFRIGGRVLFDRLQLRQFLSTLSGAELDSAGWADECELD